MSEGNNNKDENNDKKNFKATNRGFHYLGFFLYDYLLN